MICFNLFKLVYLLSMGFSLRFLFKVALSKTYFFFCLFFLNAISFYPQDSILVFDRPGISDSPYLAKKGHFLIESGFSIQPGSSISEIMNPGVILRKSVFKKGELRMSYHTLPQSNVINEISKALSSANFSIGYKQKLLYEKSWIPELALMMNVTGNNLSSRFKYFTTETYLLLHHNITEKFGLNSNLGFIRINSPGTDLGFFSLCVNYNFHHKFGMFVENFNYWHSQSGFLENAFDVGAVFMIHDKIQFDFSCIMNQNSYREFQNTFGLGFSFQI